MLKQFYVSPIFSFNYQKFTITVNTTKRWACKSCRITHEHEEIDFAEAMLLYEVRNT